MARLRIVTTGRESRYLCEDLDAGLPLHAHEPGSGLEHDVHCDTGSIVVFVHPNERHVLQAGDSLILDTTRWHGIYPLSMCAAFTNTAREPQADFESVLESPHNAPDWARHD